MTSDIKVRYSNGILTPLEPLDLEEGSEVVISINTPENNPDCINKTLSAAGGWKGSQDPDELIRALYKQRLSGSSDLFARHYERN